MPDYNKGKIYTIRCRTDETLIYVGSTIQPLSVRLGGHKVRSNNAKYQNIFLYKNKNHNWDDWYIELYEEYPCENKRQAELKEEEVRLERKAQLNMRKAFLSEEDRKEQIKENFKVWIDQNKDYHKIWEKENKEKRKEQKKLYYKENKTK